MGGMNNDERKKVMDMFTKGALKILVTTNLLARGID